MSTLKLIGISRCLQHPYLYSEDIEPRNLSPQESHEKLIDASAKLRFLKSLLPKLKERNHRVLLFSQVAWKIFYITMFAYAHILIVCDRFERGGRLLTGRRLQISPPRKYNIFSFKFKCSPLI